MTAKRIPPTGIEGNQDIRARESKNNFTLPLRLSDILDEWFERVIQGDLDLNQLPREIQQFIFMGDAHATLRANSTIRHLEDECDRLYRAAFNPRLKYSTGPSYAERLRMLGDYAKADDYETFIREFRFEVRR